jgi:hypothetical protein
VTRAKLLTRWTISTVAVAVAMLAAGETASAAAPSAVGHAPIMKRGVCGQGFDPSTPESQAHWTVTCKNDSVTIAGWVQHTTRKNFLSPDCTAVRGAFRGGITRYSSKSCARGNGGGPVVRFTWSHPGSEAKGYVYDFD